MNSIKIARTAIGIAVLAAGSSYGPVALADVAGQDWKGYAGVNCVPASGSHDIRRSVLGGQPIFGNEGSSTITVFCPVVRDVSEGGDDRVTLVRVRVRNQNPAVNGRCEFRTHDIAGNTLDAKSAVAPFGEHVLSMGPLDANPGTWGSYSLNCQLPGKAGGKSSYIVNYRVDEKLP